MSMIPDVSTINARSEFHPLGRLASGQARSFRQAVAMLLAGIEVEERAAAECGDGAWLDELHRRRQEAQEARRLYEREVAAAERRAVLRLRAAGLADFADALAKGRYGGLGW
jgi:hypothetical protein